ncbi:beta-lactamase [Formosa agariphila KMM 3901]|uniref:Beta-lactamase n=1 Tax=Formosa agariphila (strain DSM 15362 / KCTC 12365 / LMG 23005 / KMM 3901 / M-2Alg 35-1) TaxID=1347342 RepID=T2KKZ7_FORAG|nr:serine hydrolase [Formosa agariphila]CDF78674.1 beta-lactamase [Formosa agariphila KMM 3901]
MKKIIKIIGLLSLLALVVVIYLNYPKLNFITGFSSKSVCSCTFVADRSLASIEAQDNDFSPIDLATNKIDFENKSVTSTVFGLKARTAVYKEGLGCILVPEGSDHTTLTVQPNRNKTPKNKPFPYGDLPQKDTVFQNIDYSILNKAVINAFDSEDEQLKRTRAVVVVYKNQIIAEHYADGFNKDTKILGWSMTKSITSAIVGILEKQGRVSTSQSHLFPEWENDDRANLTLNNLLQMNSGLAWEEDYSKISDVTKMLFLRENMPKIPLEKQLIEIPNESWNYSSGTTNLISGFIRNQFKTNQAYLDFWYRELIDKIGMHSMTIETDLKGHFVGSSYGWATARDWSKFGLLYLHNGNWNGEQIFTKDWVEYTKTPTNTSDGIYGAQFWLNAGGRYPDVPKDLFSCNGYQGQQVSIIPSKDIVIVRFGLIEDPLFSFNTFLSEILSAIN